MTTKHAWLALAVVLLAVGCGRFRLYPAQPLRNTMVAGVTIAYDPSLPGDRQRMLDRLDVPGEMQRALTASFPPGPGPRLHVIITEFRSGRWGPTRMHAIGQLLDPMGQVVGQVQADSTGVMGASRGDLIERVSQDIVNQIAGQLP